MAFIDWPHLYELTDMMEFCKKHKEIFIYGVSEKTEMLLKYFDISGVKISGYIETFPWRGDRVFAYREFDILSFDEFTKTHSPEDAGIVLGLSDMHYEAVIPRLRRHNFDYFDVSEHNKRTIWWKLHPKTAIDTDIEVPITEHCNLNCKMCSYFSPLADEYFMEVSSFEADMKQLSKLAGGVLRILKLIGGEPLLHPEINKFIEISRRYFPSAKIIIVTNGTLLLKMPDEFFAELHRNDVQIWMTAYPVKYDMEGIEQKCRKFDVKFGAYGDLIHKTKNEKRMHKGVLDPEGFQEPYTFIHCVYLNICLTLKDGVLSPCPPAGHIENFNNYFDRPMLPSENDRVNIHNIESFAPISEIASKRVPFCRFCANAKHGQLFDWGVSKKSIDEWIDVE